MTTHSESRIVPYTADLMYRVVSEVQHYPKFLPWVVSLRVLARSQMSRKEIITAEMLVGFKNLRERYTSRVVCDPDARTIDVAQTEGVFKYLENNWRFTPEGKGCRVDFSIAFEFKSRLLNTVAGKVFAHAATQMSHAFEGRAKTLMAEVAPHRPADRHDP